jgi:hypothetical protein
MGKFLLCLARKWRLKSFPEIEKKRAGGVIQIVECLSGKCEALSSNPNTNTKNWKREKNKYSYNLKTVICIINKLENIYIIGWFLKGKNLIT